MDTEVAIEIKNLSKGFKVYQDKGSTIKEKIVSSRRRKYELREVLKDISFSAKKGDAVGLIGYNGCGKSTTLKLLTKIMYPDSGTIEMRGRVSSLIELGAGFHPDMSGRENIYINASIFGLTRKEIDARINDIIAFSELEEFIDNPVRTYSSGMYMRLAFSVAINVDADILLVDEILAVGDVNFQEKCFEKMKAIKAMGTTIVIVSHSLTQIEQICDYSIWIDNGKIRDQGIPKYVHEHYLKVMEDKRIKNIQKEFDKKEEEGAADVASLEMGQTNGVENKEKVLPSFCSPLSTRIGNKRIYFTDVRLMDANGKDKTIFRNGEPFVVQMNYETMENGLQGNFGIGIFRDDGVHVYGTNTLIEYGRFVEVKGKGSVEVVVTDNCLLPAKYMLDVAIHSDDGVKYDDIRNIIPFIVTSYKQDVGVCRLNNHWRIDGTEVKKE